MTNEMTNKEAISILTKMMPQPQRGDSQSMTHTKMTVALAKAIKALETPPNENWEEYSENLYYKAYNRGRLDGLKCATEIIEELLDKEAL